MNTSFLSIYTQKKKGAFINFRVQEISEFVITLLILIFVDLFFVDILIEYSYLYATSKQVIIWLPFLLKKLLMVIHSPAATNCTDLSQLVKKLELLFQVQGKISRKLRTEFVRYGLKTIFKRQSIVKINHFIVHISSHQPRRFK